MNEFPPITLKDDKIVGLYCHVGEPEVEDLRDCLFADQVKFLINPPDAAHLVAAGKSVFVFGRKHPRAVADSLEEVGEEVILDSGIVMPEEQYQPPLKQLLSLGEPLQNEKRDYAALGLSAGDASALIRMATDPALNDGPSESLVVWAPVHAWRALAQFRSEEAIVPLMELFGRIDEDIGDWLGADLPDALAQFGAAAFDPLTSLLADPANGEWSRMAAAKGIELIGKKHPELRTECVTRLSAQLERFGEQTETLNAFLISSLWDLRAVEAMPVIERAYAAGRVDESVTGDLEDVQIEFGLKTKRERPRKPNALSRWGDQLRAKSKSSGVPVLDEDGLFPELDESPEEILPDLIEEPPVGAVPYIAPPKTGRNDPCPCGSGKKYKKCCGV